MILHICILFVYLLISLQVTPNAGRINLSQGTPITWWALTVCLYSLTTSEEGDSWSVTERQSVIGEHYEAPPTPHPLSSSHSLLSAMESFFSLALWTVARQSLFAWRTGRAPPPGAESPQNSFLLFLFWCLKACQIWNGWNKSILTEKNAWLVPQTDWKSHLTSV